MMHFFSSFGFENESHTRERRLIFQDPGTPEAPVPASSDEERGKRMDAVLARLENSAAIQERREAALVEWQKRFPQIPRRAADGSSNVPYLDRSSSVNCAESRRLRVEHDSLIDARGGSTLPQASSDAMMQYPSPSSQSRGRAAALGATKLQRASEGVYQVMICVGTPNIWEGTDQFVSMKNDIVDPATRARYEVRHTHPSKLRLIHSQNPWIATSGRSLAQRRAEPDPYHWSDNAAQRKILDLGGNAIVTGANSVYIPKTVRTDGQNPYASGELSSKGETSSMRIAKIHQNLTTSKIEMGAYRDLDDVPAAQEAIEQYNLDMAITPGEGHNHVALLRTRLDTIRQMKKNRDIYAKGRTLFPDEALEKRYVEVGQGLDSEVRIQVQSKNNPAKYETIRLYPNRLGQLNDEFSAQLANQYGIFCEPEMVNGHARSANIYFTKPGTFELNGEKIEAVGKSSFRVPVSKAGDEPSNLDVQIRELVEERNKDGVVKKVKQDRSIANIKPDDIKVGESKVLDQNITVSRDTEGNLWTTFHAAGTYTVNGTFTDNKTPSVSATYNAQPREETQGERELRFIKTVGPQLSVNDANKFLKLGVDTLNLENVKTITPEAAAVLAEYTGRLVLHLTDWSEVATPLSKFKGSMLIVENNDKTPVSAGVLHVLATSSCGSFRPMGILEITDAIAIELKQSQAKQLELMVAKKMSAGSAHELAQYKGELWLGSIESITDADAQKFAKFAGTKLALPSLTLTDPQAKILAPISEKLLVSTKMDAKLLEAKKALDQETHDSAEKSARTQFANELLKVQNGEIKEGEAHNIIRAACNNALGKELPTNVIIEVTRYGERYNIFLWERNDDGSKGKGISTAIFDIEGKTIKTINGADVDLQKSLDDIDATYQGLLRGLPKSIKSTKDRYTGHGLSEWKLEGEGQSCGLTIGYGTNPATNVRELRVNVISSKKNQPSMTYGFLSGEQDRIIARVNDVLLPNDVKNKERLALLETFNTEIDVDSAINDYSRLLSIVEIATNRRLDPSTTVARVVKTVDGFNAFVWEKSDGKRGVGICTVSFGLDGSVKRSLPGVQTPDPQNELMKNEVLGVFEGLKGRFGNATVEQRVMQLPEGHMAWKISEGKKECFLEIGYVSVAGKPADREIKIFVRDKQDEKGSTQTSYDLNQVNEVTAHVQKLLAPDVAKVRESQEKLDAIPQLFDQLKKDFSPDTLSTVQDDNIPDTVRWKLKRGKASCDLKIGYVYKNDGSGEKELKVGVNTQDQSSSSWNATFEPDNLRKIQAKITTLLLNDEEKAAQLKERIDYVNAALATLQPLFPADTVVGTPVELAKDHLAWALTRNGKSCLLKIGFVAAGRDSSGEKVLQVFVNQGGQDSRGWVESKFSPSQTDEIIDQVKEHLCTDEERKTLLQKRVETLEKFNSDSTIKPTHPGYEKLLKRVGDLFISNVNSTDYSVSVNSNAETYNVFLWKRASAGAPQEHLGTVSFNKDGGFRKMWSKEGKEIRTLSTTSATRAPSARTTPSPQRVEPPSTMQDAVVPPTPTLPNSPPTVPEASVPTPKSPERASPKPVEATSPVVETPVPVSPKPAEVPPPVVEEPKASEVKVKTPEENLAFVKSVIAEAGKLRADLTTLTELTPEIAKAVGTSEAMVVKLDNVRTITEDVAVELSAFKGNILDLTGVVTMDDPAMKKLVLLRGKVYFSPEVQRRFKEMK